MTHATNPSLPREAAIRPVSPSDMTALRRLNALLLPVSFPDSFYAAVLDPALSHPYSRVITWDGDGNGLPQEPKVVGAVVCIPEPALLDSSSSSPSPTSYNLYIRSLGILAPYRSLGLVSAALDDILASVRAASSASIAVTAVTAHVWTENDDGLQWYLRRGFERRGAPIQGYYRKLRPDSAVLVSRPVRADVMRAVARAQDGSDSSPAAPRQVPPPSATAAIINRPPPPAAAMSCGPPPPPSSAAKGQSFQNQRSETEWNDLPADMMGPAALPLPRRNLGGGSEPGSGAVSGASSRSSSSAAKKKRDRSYPAAAFGS